MNNSRTDQINEKPFSSSIQAIYRLFLSGVCAVFLTCSVAAQQGSWHYVTTITEGVKFYLGSDRQPTADGNLFVREKILTTDGSFLVSFVEWDCRLKNRRTRQTTVYNADNTVRGTYKDLRQSPVVPGSSGELLFRQICLPPPAEAFVEIIVPNAELRVAPNVSAPVARTAARGERFRLMTNSGSGGWYNIVEPQSARDYRITGDCLRVVSAPPPPESASPPRVPPAAKVKSPVKATPPIKAGPGKHH